MVSLERATLPKTSGNMETSEVVETAAISNTTKVAAIAQTIATKASAFLSRPKTDPARPYSTVTVCSPRVALYWRLSPHYNDSMR